jgi:hypothetical protein
VCWIKQSAPQTDLTMERFMPFIRWFLCCVLCLLPALSFCAEEIYEVIPDDNQFRESRLTINGSEASITINRQKEHFQSDAKIENRTATGFLLVVEKGGVTKGHYQFIADGQIGRPDFVCETCNAMISGDNNFLQFWAKPHHHEVEEKPKP